MVVFLSIIVVLAVVIYFYSRQPIFGKAATGERLSRMKASPNYKNGVFQNLRDTPNFTEGATFFGVLGQFLFGRSKRGMPVNSLPSKRAVLSELDPNDDVLLWFGHSSYYMQLDGKKILVDPVLSGHASPVKFTTKSFKGSDVYTVDDFPEIDYLLITHDHYDHFDYETIIKLKPKVRKVITGLGVGEHLEHWGYNNNIIFENDWGDELILDDGFMVNTTPARHFSGRGFKRNITLWVSFVLTTPTKRIYIGGDSGYDTHFKNIGEQFGPFDLVILENGQYNKSWKYIHMMPEEVVQAAEDLKAKQLLPVHWSKFTLSLHDWDEPIIRVLKEANRKNMPIIHPMIGEMVHLKESGVYETWWEGVG